jgi:hypothetical protein
VPPAGNAAKIRKYDKENVGKHCGNNKTMRIQAECHRKHAIRGFSLAQIVVHDIVTH